MNIAYDILENAGYTYEFALQREQIPLFKGIDKKWIETIKIKIEKEEMIPLLLY